MVPRGSARVAEGAVSNSGIGRLVPTAEIVQFLPDGLKNRVESPPVLLWNVNEHIDRAEQTLLGHWLPLASRPIVHLRPSSWIERDTGPENLASGLKPAIKMQACTAGPGFPILAMLSELKPYNEHPMDVWA
jgi:hypothetical protein